MRSPSYRSYQNGLQQLLRMQPDLSLNPFIASHLPALMNHIQELAISQYVVPFVSVRLQVSFSLVVFPSHLMTKVVVWCSPHCSL